MSPALTFEQMLTELATRHKLELRGYKFSTLHRRAQRRMEQVRVQDYASYLRYVEENPEEATELLHTVLINVTRFFREAAAWHVLRNDVLPDLLHHHRTGETLKVWCVGCSTGEEPYSIALLIADYFGSDLKDNDIKIYGTDDDDDALRLARKGVYKLNALTSIPARYRRLLKVGADSFQMQRDVRRLVIFGRSNVVSAPPISRVQLLICRNLLIYFEQSAQEHIMKRFAYALEAGGVLFLGKSESQLRSNQYFAPLDSRWRIFRRTNVPSPLERPVQMDSPSKERLNERAQQELEVLKAYHEAVLDTLEPGVLLVDVEGNVIRENDSARRLWQTDKEMTGGKIRESTLLRKCPELREHLDSAARDGAQTSEFKCTTPEGQEVHVVVRPIQAESGKALMGTLIYMKDVTPHGELQHTVEQLQTTAEELQSTNEELETTNEELLSTNEELETTNEELQSTNEELETTNEELKSLNEELEEINGELNKRSRQLDEFTERYSEMVEQMPWPLVLARADGTINIYNSAAQNLFGFATPANGMNLRQIPMTQNNHIDLAEHIKEVAETKRTLVVEDFKLSTNSGIGATRVHIRPMPVGEKEKGAMVMFEVVGSTIRSGFSAKTNGKTAQVQAKKKSVKPAKKNNGSKRN